MKRREAKVAGLKRYFTGKPCKYGHLVERRTSNKTCVECAFIQNKKIRMINLGGVNLSSRMRYLDNKEKYLIRSRLYRINNTEKYLASKIKWRKLNSDKVNAAAAERRAQKLKATPTWADKNLIRGIYLKAKVLSMQVDHIVPLKHKMVCGLHTEHNLQLLSAPENNVKNNLFVP